MVSGGHTWFVTGAAGFIGSNLCAWLLDKEERVIGYDNFLTGKRANIDRLRGIEGADFSFVEGDIRDGKRLADALNGATRLVHLAAQISVQLSFDDPVETDEINVAGFLRVLQAAAAAGVARFFYASSCAVYGDNPALPLAETSITTPLSPYAASKLINEHYAQSLATRHPGMEMVGLRLFNIFGPYQDHYGGYAAVIPRWISLLMADEQPIVYGDGSATRDFCYVGNVCELIHDLGSRDASVPNRIYNIGTGKMVSLSELFSTVREQLTSKGVKVAFATPQQQAWRTGDIVHSYADIRRARDELGYTPAVELENGIDCILEYEYGLD